MPEKSSTSRVEEPRHVAGVGGALREIARGRKGTARVLVVEPDPELQAKIARHLTVRGHRVVGATSVAAAHALTQEWDVDVVVIDEQLGHDDPVETAQRIQGVQPWAHIVMMGRGPDPAALLAAPLEGVAYLAKPFRADALSELLEQIVARLGRRLSEPEVEVAPGE